MKIYWKLGMQLLNLDNHMAVENFLLELKNTNKSYKTITNYRYILESFFKDRKERYSSITYNCINQFLDEYPKKLMESTKRGYLNGLSSFFRFCVKKRYMKKSPIPPKIRIGKRNERYWETNRPVSNCENQKVLNAFLLGLKKANRSKTTIVSIRKYMQTFLKNKEGKLTTITSSDIKNYLEVNHKNCTKSTIKTYVYYIRSFFNYCLEQGYISKAPIIQTMSKSNRKQDEEIQKKYWIINISLLNNKNKEILNEYLLSLKVMNYSEETIKHKRSYLQTFFREAKLFSILTSNEILEKLKKVTEGKKEKTIYHHIGNLKCFYAFCVEEGYLEKSPIKSRWFPRLPKPVPKYLEKKEVVKVQQLLEKDSLRNRVLFELLLSSGCRIGEVQKIDRENIDLEKRTVLVLGKGRKFRQVHFTVKCALLLERYLECRNDKEPALFVTMKGEPKRLSRDYMRKIIGRLGKKAGLRGSLYPHRLRHTFATDLLAKGAELSFIADELGHSNLMTTQVYARLPKREIISMYRKYMG